MHNLGTVVSFEFFRTVKKKAFWLSILIFPAIMALVFGISYFSNQQADKNSQDINKEKFSLAVVDDSALLSPAALAALAATTPANKAAGIEEVRSGKVDAFFYYPQNPAAASVEVYAKDAGLTDNGKYTAVASQLLKASVASSIGASSKVSIVQGNFSTSLKTYKDGAEAPGYERVILPGFFLVLFYLVIILLGNQMLSSTTEEKENRVIEMILTAVEPRTLIIGKILSLILVGAIQVLVTALPTVIALTFFRSKLHLPDIDFTKLHADPVQMIIAVVVFIAAFLLFTGILVAIGAAVPTAKEASRFFGFAMFCMFVPFYAVYAIVTSPGQLIVKFFTFFPLTAPITLLLRNAAGNLSSTEAVVGIAILIVSCLIALRTAIHAFQYGTLEYGRKLSLREMLGR